MEGNPIEILYTVLVKRILLTMAGLFSCIMGLWIYRSTFTAMGFLVGLAYAGYITFIFFSKTILMQSLSDIKYLLVIAAAMIIGGFIGTAIARAFEAAIFFLAGGIVALTLARLWIGTIVIEDLMSLESFRNAITSSIPKCWEFFVFFIGGVLYALNVRFIIAITTAALGGLCIRWVWGDVLVNFHPHAHDIIAIVLMIFGTLVQMRSFRGRREFLPPAFKRTDFDNR